MPGMANSGDVDVGVDVVGVDVVADAVVAVGVVVLVVAVDCMSAGADGAVYARRGDAATCPFACGTARITRRSTVSVSASCTPPCVIVYSRLSVSVYVICCGRYACVCVCVCVCGVCVCGICAMALGKGDAAT